MSNILIEQGAIVTVDDAGHVHTPGYLFLEADRIAAVGAGAPPSELRERADTIIDASHMAVMPGMVNAHTHLFQTFLRGLADDKPLLEWLKVAIWPVAQALTEHDAYIAAMLGLVENLRGGATSVIDHQYVHTEAGNDDGVFRAAQETGVRFLLARGWADTNYHPAFMETPDRIIAEMAPAARRLARRSRRPPPAGVWSVDPLGLHRRDHAPHLRSGRGSGASARTSTSPRCGARSR